MKPSYTPEPTDRESDMDWETTVTCVRIACILLLGAVLMLVEWMVLR